MSLPNNPGAWIPWDVVLQLPGLKLSPPSRWQVFLAVLFTSCRYGQRDALLTVLEIANRTGLSERTVKNAIGDLVACGAIRRTARRGRFAVNLLRPPEVAPILRGPLPPDCRHDEVLVVDDETPKSRCE